jgi:hypothetical protein
LMMRWKMTSVVPDLACPTKFSIVLELGRRTVERECHLWSFSKWPWLQISRHFLRLDCLPKLILRRRCLVQTSRLATTSAAYGIFQVEWTSIAGCRPRPSRNRRVARRVGFRATRLVASHFSQLHLLVHLGIAPG